MKLPLFQIDAFTDHLFGGNPAAVVLLESWLPDKVLAAIAAENNLAETAFLIPGADEIPLRWFTPTQAAQIALPRPSHPHVPPPSCNRNERCGKSISPKVGKWRRATTDGSSPPNRRIRKANPIPSARRCRGRYSRHSSSPCGSVAVRFITRVSRVSRHGQQRVVASSI